MKKSKWKYATPEETRRVFAPGCVIDWDNNIIYGADGQIYRDVQISRKAVEQWVNEEIERAYNAGIQARAAGEKRIIPEEYEGPATIKAWLKGWDGQRL
jgi:ribosome modulation factor